jgi:hypothetical protein
LYHGMAESVARISRYVDVTDDRWRISIFAMWNAFGLKREIEHVLTL